MKCNICSENLIDNAFVYINAAGESTISKISISDCELVLCPECTNKLNSFLKELIYENKDKRIKKLRKQKIIKMSDIKNV